MVRGRAEASYAALVRFKAAVTVALTIVMVAAALQAMRVGPADMGVWDVIRGLAGRSSGAQAAIVWNVRLPRVLAAVVTGIGLSISGVVMQNVLRNPLASSYTLGISQAAAFGAATAIIVLGAGGGPALAAGAAFLDAARSWSVAGCAFAASMVAALGIFAFARRMGAAPEVVVLVGVALGSLFSAGTVVLQYFAEDTQVARALFWTFGDLGRACWSDLAVMSAATLGGGLYFMWRRWDYNALEAGAEAAAGLGVHVERVRLSGMLMASLVTAVCVASVGVIGFVGLVAPHIVRRMLGNDLRYLIPASAAAGGALLVVADTFARTVVTPVVLPVGAITSFLGAPTLLYLLLRRRRAACF